MPVGSKRSAAEDEDEDEESDDEDEKPSVKAGRARGGEKGAAEVLDEGEVPEEDKE